MLRKYQGDQLLETLNSLLMMPDCPARLEATSASRPVRTPRTPSREATTGARTSQIPRLRPRRGTIINAIGAANPNSAGTSGCGCGGTGSGSASRNDTEEYYDYDQGVPDNAPAEPFMNYNEAVINLLQIEGPDQEDTPNNLFTFDCYRTAVHAIRDNPNAAYAQHCVVCRGQHCFKNCPTLNNNDFLKQHYIRFYQNVCRDQNELTPQRGEPVNFMDRTYFDDEESESDSSNRDFPYGRR